GLRDLHGGLRGEVDERLERVAAHLEVVAAHGRRARPADGHAGDGVHVDRAVPADAQALVAGDGPLRALRDLGRLVRADRELLRELHRERVVVADLALAVVGGLDVLVLVGVDVDLFGARGVLDPDLVVTAAARGAVRLEGRARLAAGERVRRHVL